MPKYMPRNFTMDGSKNKEGAVSLQYPMLAKNNYTPWAIKMKVFMQAQGVWDAIEPADPKAEIEDRKDKMAMAAIYQGIPEEMLLSLAEKKTAREAWDALETIYMGEERVKSARIQTLKSEFEMLRMKESESIDDFAIKLHKIATNIRTLGEKFEEACVVKKLLRAVPTKYLQIASTIEQFGDMETMTVEEAVGRLRCYEERIRGHEEIEGNQLLLTQEEWLARSKKGSNGESSSAPKARGNNGGNNRGRGSGRGRGRGGGRGGRGCNNTFKQEAESNRNSSGGRDKSNIKCFNCDFYGHYVSECRKPRRGEQPGSKSNSDPR
ncbi:unnamed protein product [Cuscuta epithymum]|uniref:CCHC-type domain-containing protein n=1 Tax=Cuscuta epithymum TaxID=186058 RepID=A0AAV0FRP8_9ASTE|nr:unnamed protein product [Cuscuta epithymum]CAH9138346.1 unnamed protein product [Cuscuta epithymum]